MMKEIMVKKGVNFFLKDETKNATTKKINK